MQIYLYIYLHLPLTSIHKLRYPDAVSIITLPPEPSKSLVNEKNMVAYIVLNQYIYIYIYIYIVASGLMNINIITYTSML